MTTQIETKKKVNRIQTLSPFEMHNGIASDPQFTVDELREQHIGPNRKDALAAAAIPKEGKCFGYAGKILYVDLTDGSAKTIPSSTYLPKWIGGVSLAFKMFYDDVPASAKAFDPENEVIFASGPTTATGLPTSSRAEFVSINPHSIPEQISWSGIGGHMSVQMKFAGYDAVAIRGKADQPVILFVDDDKVTLVDATECWGKLIHDSLDWIRETLGDDVECCAIGPAGEKLCRDACVTTRTDNTASKSGLGAVFGSKNLKGLAFRGTKAIKPYDTEKVFSLRRTVAQPKYQPAPVTHDDVPETVGYLEGLDKSVASVEGGVLNGRLACGYGCSMRCNKVILNSTSVFTGKQIAQMDKCCTQFSWDNRHDELAAPFADPVGAAGNVANSMSYPTDLSQMDFTDPALLATAAQLTPGDSYDWPIYGWNINKYLDILGY